MSSVRKLHSYFKTYIGGTGSAMSISGSWSSGSCPKSTASASTDRTVSSLNAFGELDNLMVRQTCQSGTTPSSSASTSATSSSANTASSVSSEEREIGNVTQQLIDDKNDAFEELMKLIKILCIKVSPFLLYMKIKYATCCTSRVQIQSLVSFSKILSAEVQKLDCYDEHALYVLAAMYNFAQVQDGTMHDMNSSYVLDVLKTTMFWKLLNEKIVKASEHVGNAEQIVKMHLNSAAISIVNRKYKITGGNILPGKQLLEMLFKTLLEQKAMHIAQHMAMIIGVEKMGTLQLQGGRKKHLRKTQKK